MLDDHLVFLISWFAFHQIETYVVFNKICGLLNLLLVLEYFRKKSISYREEDDQWISQIRVLTVVHFENWRNPNLNKWSQKFDTILSKSIKLISMIMNYWLNLVKVDLGWFLKRKIKRRKNFLLPKFRRSTLILKIQKNPLSSSWNRHYEQS